MTLLKEYAHVLVSLGFGMLVISVYNLFFFLGLLYALFPFYFFVIARTCDWLDHKLYREHERRFLTHSPLSPLLIMISMASGGLFSVMNLILGITVGITTYVIFFLHFLLDLLNPSGVPLTPRKHLKGLRMRYDDLTGNVGLSLIGISLLGFSLLLFFAFPPI